MVAKIGVDTAENERIFSQIREGLRDLVAEGTPAEKIETLTMIERLTSFNGEAVLFSHCSLRKGTGLKFWDELMRSLIGSANSWIFRPFHIFLQVEISADVLVTF